MNTLSTIIRDRVASFTDAWIETYFPLSPVRCRLVASFTDAWIETECLARKNRTVFVASFTDAWIETIFHFWGLMILTSRPSRTRGLKHPQLR